MAYNYDLNNGWKFSFRFSDKLLLDSSLYDSMESIRIPHNVKDLPLNYLDEKSYQTNSLYMKKLDIKDEWKGKRILVRFDGAAHQAEVFLNGKSLCTHSCGYTSFTVDLTENIRYGHENMLAVRLDSRETLNIPPFGNVVDYLTYGGIYRPVTLIVSEDSRISSFRISGDDKGRFRCIPDIVNGEGCEIKCEILKNGKSLCKSFVFESNGNITCNLNDFKKWDVDSPELYTFKLKLFKNGSCIDEMTDMFGFRTIEFKADGFYLNGKKLKLRGLNRHQSWPYIGYAAPDRAQRLDADILKYELGCNAVRTSHYPQSHAFIRRCDEIGLLVFTEIPGWQHIGNSEWKKVAIENTKEMVMQYYNHPSIFMWGVRINESKDDDEFYKATNKAAHLLDDTRPTGGVRCIKKSNLLEDVYTYNDFCHIGTNLGCEPKKNITSDMSKGYLISEYNGHMYPTKAFDWEEKRLNHALRHAKVLNDVSLQDDIGGSFGWCMFDYNTHKEFGSGDKICYHGVMDMFRNKKTAAYVYSTQDDSSHDFMVTSSMDIGEHPAGSLGKIYAFTNADEVRFYKNNEFVKAFTPSKKYSAMKHPPICIDDIIGCLIEKHEGYTHKVSEDIKECLFAAAKYGASGMPLAIKLKVGCIMLRTKLNFDDATVLYNKYIGNWGGESTRYRFEAIKDGKVVSSIIREGVDKCFLKVTSDTLVLHEDHTWDMASIRIQALDQNHNLVPYFNRPVKLEVSGECELIGQDIVTLNGGMGGCYIRTTGKTGTASLKISCTDTDDVILNFKII